MPSCGICASRGGERESKKTVAFCIGMLLFFTFFGEVAVAAPVSDPFGMQQDSEAVAVSVETISAKSLSFSGHVYNPNGVISPEARVRILAWPAGLDRIKEGESFDLVEIGSTVSDKSGRFRLSSDSVALRAVASDVQRLSASKQSEIPVDVEIVADTGDGVASFATTLFFNMGKGEMRAQFAKGGAAERAVGAHISSEGVELDLRVPGGVVPDVRTQNLPPMQATSLTLNSCRLVTNYGPRWTTVGSIGATTSGYIGRVKYSSGATTEITEGISLSGSYGSFSINGTTNEAATATITFPQYSSAGYYQMRTQFTFGRFVCQWGATGGVRYVVRASGFAGGTNVVAVSVPSATYCTPYYANTGFNLHQSTAETFEASVSGLYSLIGFNFSSRTGYSSGLNLDFQFSSNKRLCGTRGFPGGTPYQLVVKP